MAPDLRKNVDAIRASRLARESAAEQQVKAHVISLSSLVIRMLANDVVLPRLRQIPTH